MKIITIIIAALVLAISANAEPLPQPRPSGPGGSCPHGYFTSGSFCMPNQGAQDAVPKPPSGTCPWGWASSGSFCLRSGRSLTAPLQADDRLADFLTEGLRFAVDTVIAVNGIF